MSTYDVGSIVFDHWVITEKLGSGSFGRVYKIQRKDFGETYYAALKVITVPQSEDELRSAMEEGMSYTQAKEYFYGVVEDVVREFSLMSKLKGITNVVDYMDHLVIPQEDGIGWDILIRMELLTPVLTYAYQHPMSRRDIIRLGIDMCRALELCQRYNIIHRDIKPENIFVSDNGDFKLGDFGIARTIENTMSGLSQKGTYSYMAPEIYHGEEYGYSVDIYSLGIVLYRLLNKNRVPFLPPAPQPITHRDREDALVRRMSGEAVTKPFYSEGRLSEIVLKACAYDPKERYSSPAQMRQELEAILYDQSESELIYPDGDTLAISENKYWTASGVKYESNRRSAAASDRENTVKTDERAARPAKQPDRSRSGAVAPQKKQKKKRWKAVFCAVLVVLALAAIGGGVMLRLRSQHLEQFQSLMEQGNAICDTDPQVAIDLFARAQSLYPKEPAPYIAHAYALYSAGDYANCISYIEDELALGKSFDAEQQGQLSEILAAAYFEQGDYTEAASFFRLSTAGGDLTVPAMRDYAVSLGRIGDIEAADEVLQRMYDAGAEGDVTDYVQSEVDYALGNYATAEEGFLGVLGSTSDDLLKRRCVRSLGEVYRDCAVMEAQGNMSPISQPAEKSARLLSGAMVEYGLDYDSVLWEMLAKAYYDAYHDASGSPDYLEKAAQAFQRVIDLGIKKEYLYSNLFSVYYEMQNYEKAGAALDAYEEQFPQAYTPHALRSMLLITTEGEKPQEERNYQAAMDEYALAGKMIRGDDDATYYQQLEGYIQRLYETGNADANATAAAEAYAENTMDAWAGTGTGSEPVPAPVNALGAASDLAVPASAGSGQAPDDSAWKLAYNDLIISDWASMSEDVKARTSYHPMKVSDSGPPMMFISYGGYQYGGRLCYYSSDGLHSEQVPDLYIAYVEGSDRMSWFWGHEGYYYEAAEKWDGTELTELGSGEYGASNGVLIDEDNGETAINSYIWEGKAVSREEYRALRLALWNEMTASGGEVLYAGNFSEYGYDDILDWLSNY